MADQLFDLKEQWIWVIGGAGYLGQAVLRQLLSSGAKVLCLDIAQRGQDLKVTWNHPTGFQAETFDLSEPDNIAIRVQDLIKQYGTPDGLVNLTYGASGQSMTDIDHYGFQKANQLNINATFLLARAVAQYMEKRKKGSMVLFSSMYGMVSPDPAIYQPPMEVNPIEYGAGKAAVIQMTKYLGVQWAKLGIRVNCISPGPFPNPTVQQENPSFIDRLERKVPMGRVGEAHEIGGVVQFLLSKASSYMTGQNIVVDGGWTAW